MFKKILITGFVLIALLLVGGYFFGQKAFSKLVSVAVETAAPPLTGCPVKLAGVDFNPFNGTCVIRGFALGNPEGFTQDPELGAFKVASIKVEIDVQSLLSDTIEIKEVVIQDPVITYEQTLKGTNFGAILDNLEKVAPASGEAPKEEPKEDEGQKEEGPAIHIGRVLIEGAKMKVTSEILTHQSTLTIPLPTIEMTDLGGKKGDKGSSIADVVKEIVNDIWAAMGKALASCADLPDAIKDG
ncbi:MAG: hypothetical protein AB7F75_09175, partial [Planctomycetota bacterium]